MSLLRNNDVKKHLAPGAHHLTVVPAKAEGNLEVIAPETTVEMPVVAEAVAPNADLANGSLKANVV